MKKFDFCYKWLLFDSFIIIAVGVYIAFLKNTPLFILFDAPIDLVFWGNGIIDTGTVLFKGFIYSLLGVLMIVWGIQLFFIIKFALRKKEKWAWFCIFISVIVWFPIDETFSIYYGVYFNAIFNIPFLLLLLIPLILIVQIVKKDN